MNARASTKLAPLFWGLLAGWASGIWILSSMAGPELEPYTLPFPGFDKLQHAVAFALGGALQWLAFRHSTGWTAKRLVLMSVACIALFGAVDEAHQTFTPQRTGADVLDWVADVIGAALGTGFIHWIHGRRR